MSAAFIVTIYNDITNSYLGKVGEYAYKIGGAMKPLITAAFLLYMLYIVWRMYSKKDAIFEEFLDKIILFVIVGTFAFSAGHYPNVIEFVLHAGDEVVAKLYQSEAGSALGTIDNVYQAFNGAIKQIYEKWDKVSFWDKFNGTNISLMVAVVFLYISSFIFCIVITVALLTAKLMTALLLSVGVVFICFAIFPATRNMFFSWVSQCFNYFFLSIFYGLVANIAGNFILNKFLNAVDLSTIALVSYEVFLGVAIIVYSMDQIPQFVSALTGGFGASPNRKDVTGAKKAAGSIGKIAGKAVGGLAGKALDKWKNRGSGTASN